MEIQLFVGEAAAGLTIGWQLGWRGTPRVIRRVAGVAYAVAGAALTTATPDPGAALIIGGIAGGAVGYLWPEPAPETVERHPTPGATEAGEHG